MHGGPTISMLETLASRASHFAAEFRIQQESRDSGSKTGWIVRQLDSSIRLVPARQITPRAHRSRDHRASGAPSLGDFHANSCAAAQRRNGHARVLQPRGAAVHGSSNSDARSFAWVAGKVADELRQGLA